MKLHDLISWEVVSCDSNYALTISGPIYKLLSKMIITHREGQVMQNTGSSTLYALILRADT